MKLPDFDTDADFNVELVGNCGLCSRSDGMMLYAGTMTINLCPVHARAFADFITTITQR